MNALKSLLRKTLNIRQKSRVNKGSAYYDSSDRIRLHALTYTWRNKEIQRSKGMDPGMLNLDIEGVWEQGDDGKWHKKCKPSDLNTCV